MAVRATVSRFPIDSDALEASGLPWGLTVTPFAAKDENGIAPARGSNGHLLPRCENCYAYFNTYCELDQWAWNCSLCGTLNGLPSDAIARYSNPHSIPEMSSSFIDLELPLDGSEEEMTQARPVYVAAIDLSSSEEFLELTKSSLLAALEALSPGSLFGLATFSHKIGLYDVQGPVPVVKNVFIPPDAESKLPLELEDAMPLLQFLAPVETCKDRIAAALETLRPITSWERSSGAAQGMDGVLMGGRGFGTAMEALFNYLGSEFGNTFALARVFAFLSGPPDYGRGQLDTSRYGEQYASKRVDADRALLPEQTPFYKDLATIAVQSGVCVDVFAVTNEYTDLASLKFLSIESGGSLFLYSSTDDSTLPQDMFRMLNRPYAFNCVLRMRTSTEFKPLHSFGHFFPDPQYENLQHIICCDSYATYAYDFDFADNTGFSRHSGYPPVVQIAFQYTVVVPPEELSSSELPSSSRGKHTLQRRLRIRTMQFSAAQNINEIYDSGDHEVVLSLLVHKVILVSLEDGVREGRALLHDWLVILTAQYNDAFNLVQYKNVNKSMSSQIDITFSQCPQLEPLPRLVFALLRNPLLRFHEEGVHPDYRIYLQCLFRGKHTLQRRLRIRTMQFSAAQNINEIYDSGDHEVVLSLLVHKVILVSLEDGVREGRALLHDWLVILTAQYNDAFNLVQYKNVNKSMSSQIDITFSQCPQLEPLPRLVFALLRNPLLRFHEEGVHPDYRIYLQCLFSVLEPSSLHCGIYPSLMSYSTPDKQAYPRHSLSRAALMTSGSPIFFLDAYTTLIVFYSSTADPSLPFPPPQDCLLRKTINEVKQGRSITPKLMFIREGQDDATAFENYLIEEQDVGSGFASAMGFVAFLDDISQSVAEYMK
ncbi:hypothetical protein F2Q69_00012353 [Brassica cretica]|uniref:Uncharacterized protein n=1 Tax=Brassica cretica TaxID=69181 RepID=A0A8S9QRC0_BRACR|nr:hypothetical protein F2Q69_00012353 [Brassica cretica]